MNKLKILLIEDDLIEKMKFQKVIENLKVEINLTTKDNGQEGLEYLNDGDYPSLILLDLNMPEMNGIEFLRHMYNSTQLKHIPVVILSTSENSKDLKKCYELGIAGYIIKPLRYEDYVQTIKKLIDYWMINRIIR